MTVIKDTNEKKALLLILSACHKRPALKKHPKREVRPFLDALKMALPPVIIPVIYIHVLKALYLLRPRERFKRTHKWILHMLSPFLGLK
jgi:hypothetical protein